jgi:hypothetical protein
VTWKGIGEGVEAPVGINIIDDDSSARPQRFPRKVQLEAHVSLTVQTVVNKNINVVELRKQLWKTQSAGTSNVRPSIGVAVSNRNPDLLFPGAFNGRKINAPEMTVSVSRKRLQNKARGDAVGDTGLNNPGRRQVTNQAPNRPYKSSVAIVPGLEAFGTGLDPSLLQFAYDFRPQFPEF